MSPPAPARTGTRRTATAPLFWTLPGGGIDLATPLVVGILNVTPDSFSDGGRFLEREAAVARAERLVAEGARMVDVGGESTRPGAREVSADEEAARVVGVIEALRYRLPVPISIDTRKAAVARRAIEAGAVAINDVSGLSDPAMAALAAETGAGLVLMHMRGTPSTMQSLAHYGDVVAEVGEELAEALERAGRAGIDPERIVLDPGIGFAKRLEHNVRLIGRLGELLDLGRPLMLGASRKAFLGELLGGAAPTDRVVGTAAACVAGLLQGARIFRVHDVAVVREALVVAEAVRAGALEPAA